MSRCHLVTRGRISAFLCSLFTHAQRTSVFVICFALKTRTYEGILDKFLQRSLESGPIAQKPCVTQGAGLPNSLMLRKKNSFLDGRYA